MKAPAQLAQSSIQQTSLLQGCFKKLGTVQISLCMLVLMPDEDMWKDLHRLSSWHMVKQQQDAEGALKRSFVWGSYAWPQ